MIPRNSTTLIVCCMALWCSFTATLPGKEPQSLQDHLRERETLDGDGLSEIILAGVNEVLWRDGKGGFDFKPFLADWHGEIGHWRLVLQPACALRAFWTRHIGGAAENRHSLA